MSKPPVGFNYNDNYNELHCIHSRRRHVAALKHKVSSLVKTAQKLIIKGQLEKFVLSSEI